MSPASIKLSHSILSFRTNNFSRFDEREKTTDAKGYQINPAIILKSYKNKIHYRISDVCFENRDVLAADTILDAWNPRSFQFIHVTCHVMLVIQSSLIRVTSWTHGIVRCNVTFFFYISNLPPDRNNHSSSKLVERGVSHTPSRTYARKHSILFFHSWGLRFLHRAANIKSSFPKITPLTWCWIELSHPPRVAQNVRIGVSLVSPRDWDGTTRYTRVPTEQRYHRWQISPITMGKLRVPLLTLRNDP